MKYTEINNTTAEIKFYGYIGMWWISSKDFVDTIEEIEKKYANLDIRVHCYGGEVFEGTVMFNAIKRSKLNTTFIIDGISASMSAIVMLSGKKIVMADNAFVMIHAPSGYTAGNANDHFATGKLLKSMHMNFSSAFIGKTGMTAKDADAYMDGYDHWLSAQECLDMKLVDEVTNAFDTTVDASAKPDAGTPVDKIFGQYQAVMTMPSNNHLNTTNMTKEEKQSLITKHGLKNVTADSSDTAVFAAIDAAIAEKDQRINSLQQSQEGSLGVQIDAVIAAREAVLGTKFTEAQKTKFVALGKAAGVPSLKDMLEEIKPLVKVEDLITAGAEGKDAKDKERESWSFATWQEKDPAGLDKLSRSDDPKEKALFAKLYNAEFPDAKL